MPAEQVDQAAARRAEPCPRDRGQERRDVERQRDELPEQRAARRVDPRQGEGEGAAHGDGEQGRADAHEHRIARRLGTGESRCRPLRALGAAQAVDAPEARELALHRVGERIDVDVRCERHDREDPRPRRRRVDAS